MTEITKCFENYKKEGLVPFCATKISMVKDKKGEYKKKFIPPTGHQNINIKNCDNFKNGDTLCIGTGERSKITVLDFDNKEVYDNLIQKYPNLKKCRTISTNKGYHIYFKYSDKFMGRTDAFYEYKDIDIRNNGNFVFAPPTNYKTGENKTVEYKDLGGEIIDVPDIFFELYKNNENNTCKIEPPKPDKKEEEEEEEQFKDNEFLKIYEETEKKENIEKVKTFINEGYLDHMCDDFHSWMNVGFGMKNDLNYELFNLFSKRSSKYDEDATLKAWESIKHNNKKKTTIGSIIYWAINSDKYKEKKNEEIKKNENKSKKKTEKKSKKINANETDQYKEMKLDFEKEHCKIINSSFFIKETFDSYGDKNILVFTENNIRTSYGHLNFIIHMETDFRQESFMKNWLIDSDIRRYDNIDCFPDESKCPKNVFNTWMPFKMENVEQYLENKNGLEAMLSHINILCGNDITVSTYIQKWIGQMIKHPDIKTICPTFISSQGAGKGTLIKLMKKMLGNNKVFESTNPARDVWGNFNQHMANTFLVNINEISKKDVYEYEGKIKGLITDEELMINGKNTKPFTTRSYHRFIITTNNLEPINTSKDDRRNLIIKSSDEKCGDKEYFKILNDFIDDTDVVKTCYEYFKNLPDLDKFNALPLPTTTYQENLKELSKSPIDLFLIDIYENNIDKKELKICNDELFDMYNEFCTKNKIQYYEIATNKFSMRLKQIDIGIEEYRTVNKERKTVRGKLINIKRLQKHYDIYDGTIDQFIMD